MALAELKAMQLRAKECQGLLAAPEAGTTREGSACRLQREHSPAGSSILDFWLPGL